jgi:hypothetical protein
MDEEVHMHLAAERYSDERRCLDVAMRMIRFEARTYTIRTCTGLSDDRVRKLYRTYVAHEQSSTIKRRRGKSPREIQCVLQNSRTQLEASLLAGAFASIGLLDAPHAPSLCKNKALLGEQLCNAYDVYTQLLTENPLSFEHAWFLWHALIQGNDLYLRPCSHCSGLAVQDRFSLRMRTCCWCGKKQQAP